jgi:hypothetical protein
LAIAKPLVFVRHQVSSARTVLVAKKEEKISRASAAIMVDETHFG